MYTIWKSTLDCFYYIIVNSLLHVWMLLKSFMLVVFLMPRHTYAISGMKNGSNKHNILSCWSRNLYYRLNDDKSVIFFKAINKEEESISLWFLKWKHKGLLIFFILFQFEAKSWPIPTSKSVSEIFNGGGNKFEFLLPLRPWSPKFETMGWISSQFSPNPCLRLLERGGIKLLCNLL